MGTTYKGLYDLNQTMIDCNISYADFPVFAHELAHFSLTKNSLYGITHFLIKQISDTILFSELKSLIQVMKDASERTQETYSMCCTLLHVSSQYNKFFNSYYYHFKKGSYFLKYNFKDFEWILDKKGINKYIGLAERIAAIAMNVDLTKADENPWKSGNALTNQIICGKSQFMPDYRLKCILSVIQKYGTEMVDNWSDSEIASAAEIDFIEFTTNSVLSLLRNLKNQFNELEYPTGLIQDNINNILLNKIEIGYNLPKCDDFISKMQMTIIPECLNEIYTKIPLETFPHDTNNKIDMITLYDYGNECICEFADFKEIRKYALSTERRVVMDYLKNYDGIVQFYFDDYDIAKSEWTLAYKKRLFFVLKNTYYDFKTLIKRCMSGERYAFLHKLNDGVFYLFVLDNEDNVLYTCQSMLIFDLVLRDFKEGFYKNPLYDSETASDGVFWRDEKSWMDYAKIIAYMSEIELQEDTLNSFILNRIHLPNIDEQEEDQV